MKKVLVALILGALAMSAEAQRNDSIDLYSDAAFNSRVALDQVPGTLKVFVVHDPHAASAQAVSAAFRITTSPGFTGVWLADVTPHAFLLGSSPNGVSVVYNFGCFVLTEPTLLLEVTYSVFGTSENCSFLEVASHPDYGVVYVQGCELETIAAVGGKLTINPNEGCASLPVESSTWGRVKALYSR
jgi:hypothetical protein